MYINCNYVHCTTSNFSFLTYLPSPLLPPAPTAQVDHMIVERVGSRTAIVSWIPLTLHQARGFPVYFVTYGTFVAGRRRQSQTMNTTNSNVTIDGLEPLQSYWFSVDVGTARGLHRGTRGAGQCYCKQWLCGWWELLWTWHKQLEHSFLQWRWPWC